MLVLQFSRLELAAVQKRNGSKSIKKILNLFILVSVAHLGQ